MTIEPVFKTYVNGALTNQINYNGVNVFNSISSALKFEIVEDYWEDTDSSGSITDSGYIIKFKITILKNIILKHDHIFMPYSWEPVSVGSVINYEQPLNNCALRIIKGSYIANQSFTSNAIDDHNTNYSRFCLLDTNNNYDDEKIIRNNYTNNLYNLRDSEEYFRVIETCIKCQVN